MNILICPDSFKGTLSAIQAAKIIGDVFASRGHIITLLPVADGGEGSLDAIYHKVGGTKVKILTRDPFRRKIDGMYLIKGKTAYTEYASVCGLNLLKEDELDPWNATSFGFGKILREIYTTDVDKIVIALGGSATNDAGLGMLQALGAKYFDAEGNPVKEDRAIGFGPSLMKKIAKIDLTELKENINDAKVEVLSDVSNPLTGFEGTSRVYSPQKGADRMLAERLERSVKYWANIIKNQFGVETEFPGAGAAGGLGMALKVFLNAEIIPGIDGIIDLLDIESEVQKNDLIIVGEGSLDKQTFFGKAPIGIAKLAKKYNKKVIAIAGKVEKKMDEIFERGIDSVFACYGDNAPDMDIVKIMAEDNLRRIADLATNKIMTFETIERKIFILTR